MPGVDDVVQCIQERLSTICNTSEHRLLPLRVPGSDDVDKARTSRLSFLPYFTIFIQHPVPNNSNELCIISHTGVTGTTETSVVSFRDFPCTKQKLL